MIWTLGVDDGLGVDYLSSKKKITNIGTLSVDIVERVTLVGIRT